MVKELPHNWIRTNFGSVIKFKNGYAFKSKDLGNEGIPVIRIGNIKDGKIDLSKTLCITENLIKKDFIINQDDILIAMSGATTGKYGVYKNEQIVLQNQRVGNIRPISSKIISKKFIYYLLGSIKEEIEGLAYGGAQPNISSSKIEAISISLPPLPEQNRIVAKLDKLFEQLEIINGSLEKIPILLKSFRQQVLSQAVTGKLTAELRKQKNFAGWKIELAKDCCKKVQSGGTPKGGNFSLNGIPFFKVYNIVDQHISFDYKPQFISEEIQNTQCKKSICYPGDVLMNIVGPPLNKVAIIPQDFKESNINQAITVFRPKEYLNNKFLYYFLREGTPVNNLVNETRGVVGQVNISLTQCRDFEIPIPSLIEQEEIVRRVESLFNKANVIEQQYHSLKNKIKNLPQSILHKAFKGELVPQKERDGDAQELLEEIKNSAGNLVQKASARRKNIKEFSKKFSSQYSEDQEEINIAAENGSQYSNEK